ncbi:MAG: hypothetical protein OEW08_09960, partial [Gammaproteobacteria bacterium]|nr:hypothetical protein [Gammaproteobacteria bacterium]
DGVLDGKTRFINGEPGALYYGQALSGTDYRHEIGVGAFRIADTRARGGVTPSAMSAMINAARLFAESNDPLFGDAAAAPFDDQAPVFTDDTLEFVGYNREKKYVEYRISVRDNIAVQRIAVSVDVRAGEFKPAYIENILPGNLIRLYVGDVGPGTHQLLVDAMDVVGNSATKIYSVALPDGKPLLVLDTPRITKEASFRIGGRYIDEGGSGIKSIAITQNARTYTATLDSTASTWYADLTLASGTNTLSVRITDNQGLFRDVAYAIVVDDTPPDVTVAYSNAEFYRNGQVIAGKLGSASATSDPLYVPTARVGYANPAADAATLANNSIPFYSLRVSDNISAPTDIKVRFQYRLNDIIKAPYRSILATANDPALYTLPLIRELLSDDWYQANPGDVHTLDIEFTDTVGNVNTRSYQFKAFFGVPRLGINSRVRFAHVEVYTYVNGAKGGRVGACDTDAGGQCDIRVLADSQFLYAELHNGRYAEPATQTDLPLIASDTLTGLADFKGRDLTVVISPFTHLAMGLIDYAIENGVSLSSAYTQTITDLTAVYNFDVMTTVPADPQALAFSDTPPSNATRYALLLAGLSEWASNFTPASSSVTAAQAFYRDARADGLLDGFGLDAQQGRSALSFGGHTLDANDYRFQLANNALAYIKKHYTLSAPAMQAVVQNLQAWAANTHPRFGNLTPLTLNTQLPVVSVLSATLTTAANYPMRVNVTPGTVAVGAVRVGTTAATLVANTTEWNATSRLNTQGKNTLTIRVYDIANNELLTKNVDITLDNLGPDVVVTQPTGINNSTVTVADLSLTGTAADATGLDYLNLQLGTQVTRANASPWTAKFKLAPGTNTLALEARDTLGNLTTQTLTVYYSVPGPIVTFNPYSTRSANTKPQFSGTVNPLGMTFTMNATLFVQAASGWVQKATLAVVPNNANAWTLDLFTGSALTLATGNYKLSIVAQNSQKNSTITDTLFSVDTVGPNLRLLSAANTRVNPYTLNLEVIDAEGGSIVSVTVDGVNATSASNNQWTYAVPRVPSDGMRAHTVVAKDDLGNTSTQVFNVTLDTVVPLISMTDPILPAGPTQRLWRNTKNATLSYSVSDTTAPLTSGVQVNGGIVLAEGPHAQSVNVQIPLSQEGANTVRINATDGVGNTAFKEFIVYRDTLAPQLSSVTAPPSVVATAKANFVVDVIEANLSSFSVAMSAAGATPISGEIVLDVNVGTTVTTSVGTLTYTAATGRLSGSIGLGSGTNTLVIKASDAAGNVSNVITFNTRLDTTAPSISVTGLNAQTNAVVTASATLSGTLNDDTYPVNVSGKYQTLNNQCQLSAVTPFAIGNVS